MLAMMCERCWTTYIYVLTFMKVLLWQTLEVYSLYTVVNITCVFYTLGSVNFFMLYYFQNWPYAGEWVLYVSSVIIVYFVLVL